MVGNFVNIGPGVAAVEHVVASAAKGTVTFDVYGKGGTTASNPQGDIQLQAKDDLPEPGNVTGPHLGACPSNWILR